MTEARLVATGNICVGIRRFVNPPEQTQNLFKSWRFERNSVSHTYDSDRDIPLFKTEFLGAPEFLSVDPSDRDYMRIKPTPRFRTASDGSYLGALPPGPAPPQGDWFTRLRERWREALDKDGNTN